MATHQYKLEYVFLDDKMATQQYELEYVFYKLAWSSGAGEERRGRPESEERE